MFFALLTTAFAAPDLTPSISVPAGTYVYASGRYTVTVKNVGNQNASASTLSIQLPLTHTTPVLVMGTVAGKSANCTQAGTKINCNMPTIKRNQSSSVYVDLVLPENLGALSLTATTTLAADTNSANNSSTASDALINYDVTFSGGTVTTSHCTGTSLTSYYECTQFPSSISSNQINLDVGGTVSITGYPNYFGSWSQPTADTLEFTIEDSSGVVVDFAGGGTSSTCWEGVATFPSSGSAYVSPYHVCQ